MSRPRVPVYEPWLTAADADAVADAVRSGWVSAEAPQVAELERRFAARLTMPHVMAVANGTLALELAVTGLGLGPGDEVLCPAFCIISCARAIVAAGAVPVFVDARAGDYNLDLAEAARRVTKKTRAILAVHTYGYPLSGDRLREFADQHRLLVIEDAAEALGAQTPLGGQQVPCGAVGDVSVFSLYANKSVTAGEGGLVACRADEPAERIRSLRNLGFSRTGRRFLHTELGMNARLSGMGAALALSQLERLDQTLDKKRSLARAYAERLAHDDRIELPHPEPGTDPVPWMIALTLSDRAGFDASELLQRLSDRGIDARPFFVGMHRQPALRALGFGAEDSFPVCDRLSARGLYLPSSPLLDDATRDRVCGALAEALES